MARELERTRTMEQGKRYSVTNWDTTNPKKEMTVWTDTVLSGWVRGHVTKKGYPLVDTCVWTRYLADSWTWTEISE